MSSFESFIDNTNGAKTVDGLFAILQEALNREGYDKILFALLSHHHELGLKPGIGIIQNYPTDWMSYYFEKELDQIDPIPRYAAQRLEAFSWSDVEQQFALTPSQKRCMEQGREAGLYHGVGIPLRGPHGEIAGISVATSEKRKSCELHADLITAYCNQFYLAFRRLNRLVDPLPRNVHLTPREREVLLWSARGKSNQDIGTLLSISGHTVNTYMRQVFEKLGVNSRLPAVTQALHLGLINL